MPVAARAVGWGQVLKAAEPIAVDRSKAIFRYFMVGRYNQASLMADGTFDLKETPWWIFGWRSDDVCRGEIDVDDDAFCEI